MVDEVSPMTRNEPFWYPSMVSTWPSNSSGGGDSTLALVVEMVTFVDWCTS